MSIHPSLSFPPYPTCTLELISDLYAFTLAAVNCTRTSTKPSKSDIMRQAMESRGLGMFLRKHEHHRSEHGVELDLLQGDDKDLKTREIDREVKSQKEDRGLRVDVDQYLPYTSDHSVGGEQHGDDEQHTHSATSSSSPSLRCPKHEGISGPAARHHGKTGVSEPTHKPGTRRQRTPRFRGRYSRRSRRSHTARLTNLHQVGCSSSHLTATITIINKKAQQGLQRTNTRIRSSSSTQTTSEAANTTVKDPAQCRVAPQFSEPSDPQIAVYPSLHNCCASQRTDSTTNARFPQITDLQICSMLRLAQRPTAQVATHTCVKRPDKAHMDYLAGFGPPINIIPELNGLPSITSGEEQGAHTRSDQGHQLQRLSTLHPTLRDLVVETVRRMHDITANADNDWTSDHGLIAPKTGVRKEDMQRMRVWAFDNDPTQAIFITSSSLKASDRLIIAYAVAFVSQPLDHSHTMFKLLQALHSGYQMHHIKNGVYLVLLIGHNKPYLLLLLSVMWGTGCKIQGWVYLPLRCLESLGRERKLVLRQCLQLSVSFYNSCRSPRALLTHIATAATTPHSLLILWRETCLAPPHRHHASQASASNH